MKKVIYVLMFFICLNFVSAQLNYFFEIELDLKTGELKLSDLDLIEGGYVNSDEEFATYDIQLFSFDGEMLYNYSYYWNVAASYDYFPLNENTIAPERLDYDILQLNMPYFKNGKEIKITNVETRQTFLIDVSKYALCNQDYVCDLMENERDCPQDCRIDMFVEKSSVKIISQERNDSVAKKLNVKKDSKYLYYVLGILVLLILGIIIFIFRQKRKVYK